MGEALAEFCAIRRLILFCAYFFWWYFGARWPPTLLGSLSKPRRRRQRERRQTKGLMSRTIAVHVCYNSWYIFMEAAWPSG